jgi:hypothetical protein
MATFVLDLNDIDLRILRDDVVLAGDSGFAFIQGAQVEFGDAARRRARLHPRQSSNQHWHRLALDPLAVRAPNLGNLADLVYRQLRDLTQRAGVGKSDELLVAAPGTVTPDQLGLLLGVAQELGIAIHGLVDAAVAAATQSTLSGRVTHVDLSLHRATVTSLEIGETVSRLAVQEVPDAGLLHIVDGWVNVVANRFVSETRFDPLRIAETEQQVYDQVHDWLTAAERGSELIVEASHRDALRRVTVPTMALIDKAITRLRSLSDAIPSHGTVLLSHRAAGVPGLSDRLVADRATLFPLPSAALPRGIALNLERVRSSPDALKFVTRLNRAGASEPASAATPPPAAARPAPAETPRPTPPASDLRVPTHVLYHGRARAIGTRLLVGRAAFPEGHRADALPERVVLVEQSADSVWVRPIDGIALTLNAKPMVEPARARIGDVVRAESHEFVLIRVLDGEAS